MPEEPSTPKAEHLGLNVGQFEEHLHGDASLAKIQADIDLGIRLGVDGTPSIFINGRRVYDARLQSLQFLITHEIVRRGQA